MNGIQRDYLLMQYKPELFDSVPIYRELLLATDVIGPIKQTISINVKMRDIEA